MTDAPQEWDFFLTYPDSEAEAVEELYENLSTDHRVFLERLSLLPGDERPTAIDSAQQSARVTVVLVSPRSEASYFQREEISRGLDLDRRDPQRHRVVPVYLGGLKPDSGQVYYGLRIKKGIDASGGLAGAAQELRELSAQLQGAVAPALIVDPFRPLCSFSTADQALFFGRDLDIAQVANLGDQHRLVVLHGTSGSGKTSLLQAGLRPLLEKEFLWLELDPQRELLTQMVDGAKVAFERRGQSMVAREPHQALLELARLYGRRVLVVVDQAEELFQNRAPATLRDQVNALVPQLAQLMVTGQHPAVHFLISLRDDYLGHLRQLQQAGLPDVLQHGWRLPPLERTATYQAIKQPLRRAGHRIDGTLLEQVHRDLGGENGHVSPVELQMIGDALYREAKIVGRELIESGLYDSMGGAGKVLGTYLRRALDEQPQALGLLKNLLGEAGTRQPALPLAELARRMDLSEVQTAALVTELVDRRLLHSLEQGGGVAGGRYRIAHDLLAREVFELLDAAEREDVRVGDEVRRRAGDWVRSHRPLPRYPARMRNEMLAWQRSHRQTQTTEERAFLGAVRRWDRLVRHARWIMPAVMLAMTVCFGVVYAELRAREAETRAEAELEKDPGKALAWVGEAAWWRGGFLFESERKFHEQWLLAREAWENGVGWVVAQQGQEIRQLVFSPLNQHGDCELCWPKRKLLAFATAGGEVGVVDLLNNGTLRILPNGHKRQAADVAFSPDGQWLASAGFDGRVQVWNTSTWEPVNGKDKYVIQLDSTEIEFFRLRFSPNGQYLAVGSSNRNPLVLLSADRWSKETLIFSNQVGEVRALEFSPDSKLLVAASTLGEVRLIPIEASAVAGKIYEGQIDDRLNSRYAVYEALFSVDGNKLLLAGQRGIQSANSPFINITDEKSKNQAAVTSLSFLPDSSSLIWGDVTGMVWMGSPQIPNLVTYHKGGAWHVETSSDGKWMLSTGSDALVQIISIEGVTHALLRGHSGRVAKAVFSPDGTLVASSDLHGQIRIWPIHRENVRVLGGIGLPIFSVVSPDPQSWIAGMTQIGKVLLWKKQSSDFEVLFAPGDIMGICACGPDCLLVASNDGTMARFTVAPDGSVEKVYPGDDPISAVVCSSTDSSRVISGHSRSIRVWGKPGEPDIIQQQETTSSLMLIGEQTLISASGDGALRKWNLLDKSSALTKPYGKPVRTLARGSKDNEVFFAAAETVINKWNLQSLAFELVHPPHAGEIRNLSTSPDNQFLASAAEDGLRIRWLSSGAYREVPGHRSGATAVSFSPSGSSLLSGGSDGSVRVYPLPPRERAAFQRWLETHTAWQLRGGDLIAKPLPSITEAFTGPQLRKEGLPAEKSPSPRKEEPSAKKSTDPHCIEKCRRGKLDTVTMEHCVAVVCS